MISGSASRRNRRRYRRAVRQAKSIDGQVCVTYAADGTPVYFAVSAEATNDEVRQRAMAMRGTPINQATLTLSRLLDNPGDMAEYLGATPSD